MARRKASGDSGVEALHILKRRVSDVDTPPRWFTSTEVVYGVASTDVTVLPEYGVSP